MLQAFTKRFCLLTVVMLLSVVNALAQDVIIGSVADLIAFRNQVNDKKDNFAGKTVLLTEDLDLSGEDWTPIGLKDYYFVGTFDGNNHTISNLTIDQSGSVGLFYHFGGTIKNLTLTDVNIKGTYQTGAFAGWCSGLGTIENCHVNGGTITSTPALNNKGEYDDGNNVGGIIGYMTTEVKWETTASSIKDCSVKNVTIRAYRRVGGIAGLAQTTAAVNGEKTSITGCTVENVTILQDNTHPYKKDYTQDSDYKIGELVGQEGDIIKEGNTTSNVTIKMYQIFDETTYVAQIGDEKYETLEAAFAAVPDNEETTITMIGDYNTVFSTTSFVEIAAQKNIILDLNGHTIVTGTTLASTSQLFNNFGTFTIQDSGSNGIIRHGADPTWVYEGGENYAGSYASNLISNRGGKVYVKSGTLEQISTGSAAYVIDTYNAAETYIEGGNCISAGSTLRLFYGTAKLVVKDGEITGHGYPIIVHCGKNSSNTLEISGGKVLSDKAEDGYSVYAWSGDLTNNTSSMTISGGTFNALVATGSKYPAETVSISDGTFTEFYSWNEQCKPITGGTYSVDPTAFVAEGYVAVDNGDGTYTVKKAIVMIKGDENEDGAYYATLEEAFAAVKDGQTISLMEDITLKALDLTLGDKKVTLALDGNTLNGRVNLKSGTLTVEGYGKVANPNGQALNVYGSATAGAKNYSVLNVNCAVEAGYGVCMFGAPGTNNGYGAVVNILPAANLDCTDEAAIFVSGNLGQNIADDMNNVINIKGQVYDTPNAGVALYGNATVNVLDGATVAGNTGISIKRGVLNVVKGAKVYGEGEPILNPAANNNGIELTGAAISMTGTYNKYGSMAVNISGGEIISESENPNAVALFKKEGNYTNAATFAVSGGTFSSPVLAEFCAEGFEPKDNGDGTFTVTGNGVAFTNDVKDENNNVVATETVTVNEEGEATIQNVTIEQTGVKNVTVSAAIGSAEVKTIADDAFKSLAGSGVQTIDLSSTQVVLEGERKGHAVLGDIPETALIYLPSGNTVTGTNVVIKDAETEKYTCADFKMVDQKDYSVPQPFTATNAKFDRVFTAKTKSTICLPFNVPASAIPGNIYKYTGVENGDVIMTEDADGLDANVPYIFIPSEASESISSGQTVTVEITDTPTSKDGFSFIGVYEKKTFTEDELANGIYGYAGAETIGATAGKFVKCGYPSWVAGMRAYLTPNSVSGAPGIDKAPANLPSYMNVILRSATGETTDILSLDLTTDESGAPVYNLSGQRVNNATKGIYIKNGKKVIIK